MKRRAKLSRSSVKRLGARIGEALNELNEALASGKPLDRVFTVHTLEIPQPRQYDAKAVRAIRAKMAVSQGVFARLIGVSPQLVEHWEQGVRTPRPIACRLLDEINRDPSAFLARTARFVA